MIKPAREEKWRVGNIWNKNLPFFSFSLKLWRYKIESARRGFNWLFWLPQAMFSFKTCLIMPCWGGQSYLIFVEIAVVVVNYYKITIYKLALEDFATCDDGLWTGEMARSSFFCLSEKVGDAKPIPMPIVIGGRLCLWNSSNLQLELPRVSNNDSGHCWPLVFQSIGCQIKNEHTWQHQHYQNEAKYKEAVARLSSTLNFDIFYLISEQNWNQASSKLFEFKLRLSSLCVFRGLWHWHTSWQATPFLYLIGFNFFSTPVSLSVHWFWLFKTNMAFVTKFNGSAFITAGHCLSVLVNI